MSAGFPDLRGFPEEEAEPDISPTEPLNTALDRIIDVMGRSSNAFMARSVTGSESDGALEHYEERARNACEDAKDDFDRRAKEVASQLDGAVADFLAFKDVAIRRLRGLPDRPVSADDFERSLRRVREACREIAGELAGAVKSPSIQQKRERLGNLRERLRRADEALRDLDAILAERIQA
jgi:hypothetical protein